MTSKQALLFDVSPSRVKEKTITLYVTEDGTEYSDKVRAQKAAAALGCQPHVDRYLSECLTESTERFREQMRRHITAYEAHKLEPSA